MIPIPRYLRGQAATRWIIDASTLAASSLTSFGTWSGGGQVTKAALNTPGGELHLAGNDTAATAGIFFPDLFGNAGGSVAAWSIEAHGLKSVSSRGALELGFQSQVYGPSQRTVFRWDNDGMFAYTSGTAPTRTLKAGNFAQVSNISARVLVSVTSGSTADASSNVQVGGVEAAQWNGVFAAGLQQPFIQHTGVGDVSVRTLAVTAYWGARGDLITKVL